MNKPVMKYKPMSTLAGYVNKKVAVIQEQLTITPKDDPNYEWLVNRLEQCKNASQEQMDKVGTDAPVRRDRSNMKHYNKPRDFQVDLVSVVC